MATIDLNNLIRPKKVNTPTTDIKKRVQSIAPIYVDLHLDMDLEKSIGLGDRVVGSKDILADTDIEAVKNSMRNIFSTKKGEKVLNPEFGCSLEKYLFSPVKSQLNSLSLSLSLYYFRK
jgi:hypothetical protein